MAASKSPTSSLVGKKKSKKKAQKDTGPDQLQQISHEIENLKFEDAETVITEGQHESGTQLFRVGGALSMIQSQEWFKDGHDSFSSYVVDKFDMKHAKARYMIRIYRTVVDLGIPWKVVDRIGWSKFREIEPILNKNNMKDWFRRALALNVVSLQAEVREARKGTGEAIEGQTTSVKTLSFPTHEDQRDVIEEAVKSAMLEANTESRAVALTSVCMAYNAGAVSSVQASKEGVGDLKATLQSVPWEQVIEMLESLHKNIEFTVTVYEPGDKNQPDQTEPEPKPAKSASKKKPTSKKKGSKKKGSKKKAA